MIGAPTPNFLLLLLPNKDENSARKSSTMSRYGLDSPASISSKASNSPLSLYPLRFEVDNVAGSHTHSERKSGAGVQRKRKDEYLPLTHTSHNMFKTPLKPSDGGGKSSYVCSECVRYENYTMQGSFGQHFVGQKCWDQNCKHFGRTYH